MVLDADGAVRRGLSARRGDVGHVEPWRRRLVEQTMGQNMVASDAYHTRSFFFKAVLHFFHLSSNRKLLGGPGTLLGAPGIATRSIRTTSNKKVHISRPQLRFAELQRLGAMVGGTQHPSVSVTCGWRGGHRGASLGAFGTIQMIGDRRWVSQSRLGHLFEASGPQTSWCTDFGDTVLIFQTEVGFFFL